MSSRVILAVCGAVFMLAAPPVATSQRPAIVTHPAEPRQVRLTITTPSDGAHPEYTPGRQSAARGFSTCLAQQQQHLPQQGPLSHPHLQFGQSQQHASVVSIVMAVSGVGVCGTVSAPGGFPPLMDVCYTL